MYYKPSCVEGVLSCKDICGKKCIKECLELHDNCKRGKLGDEFMFCSMRSREFDLELPYTTYELQSEKTVKDGKQAYKKMEKIVTDLPFLEHIQKFKNEYLEYARHEVKSWYLNTVRNTAFSPEYMPSHSMFQVMDFAQNIVHEKRHAVSEEYFHKAQSALHGTVTTICTPSESGGPSVKHAITQMTVSDNKYLKSFNIYKHYHKITVLGPRTVTGLVLVWITQYQRH